MNKQIKITTRRRVVVYGGDDKAPFWVEHIIALIVIGLIVLIGSIVVLSLSDGGRATMVWLGLGIGLVMAIVLFRDPWRSRPSGAPATVWVGESLSAFGWTATIVMWTAGPPYIFWRGLESLPEGWKIAMPLSAVGFIAITGLGIRMQTRAALPALDRTARSAQVMFNTDDADGRQSLSLRYQSADGEEHDAELADLIHDSHRDRFAPGTTWQVYAFRDPELANTVIFLTEVHDDVWRNGYKLDGVRLGGEGGPLKPGPGSPFLREDSPWSFEP